MPARATLRLAWFVAGLIFLGAGVAGIILPGLPGTVLVILSAACFSRSSPRLEAWILDHPRFGPPVRLWRDRGAIPPRAKRFAVGMMVASFALLGLLGAPPLSLAISGLAMVGAAIFVLTRPDR